MGVVLVAPPMASVPHVAHKRPASPNLADAAKANRKARAAEERSFAALMADADKYNAGVCCGGMCCWIIDLLCKSIDSMHTTQGLLRAPQNMGHVI